MKELMGGINKLNDALPFQSLVNQGTEAANEMIDKSNVAIEQVQNLALQPFKELATVMGAIGNFGVKVTDVILGDYVAFWQVLISDVVEVSRPVALAMLIGMGMLLMGNVFNLLL